MSHEDRRRSRKLNDTWKADELTDTLTTINDETRHSRRDKVKEKHQPDNHRKRSERDSNAKQSQSERTKSSRKHDDEKYHISSRSKHKEDANDHKKSSARDVERRDKERSSKRREHDRKENHREKENDEQRRNRRREQRKEEDHYRKSDNDRHRDKEQRRSSKHKYDDEQESRRVKSSRHDRDGEENSHRRREKERRHKDKISDDQPDKNSEEYLSYKEEKKEKRRREKEREMEEEKRRERKSRHRAKDDERHKQRKETKEIEAKVPPTTKESNKENEHVEDYGYDDDDFEDYESDFEIDDDKNNDDEVLNNIHVNPELSELARAIAEENNRAKSGQSRYGSASTTDRSPRSADGSYSRNQEESSSVDSSQRNSPVMFINFKAATKKSSRTKLNFGLLKRFKDLKPIITMDTISFNMLDMEPVTEYSIYMKNFGNSNTQQVSTQCHDDNLEQEVQTESPDSNEKWTQHPPHDIKVSGDGLNEEINEDYHKRMMDVVQADSKRLAKFMLNSCNLIKDLINEETSWLASTDNKNQSDFSFCESYTSVQTNLGYLQGRKVIHATFSPDASSSLIAVAFEPAAKEYSTRVDRKGVIVVWDIRKSSMPEKVLVCDTAPTCCCFSPLKSHLLFVGTDDGCVLAYDLKEPSAHHQVMALEKGLETALRNATYTTGFYNDGHSSTVVCVTPVSTELSDNFVYDDHIPDALNTGLAFQLASLEEMGYLCIWVVIESNVELDSESDLGLAPHGKVRLVKNLKIQILPAIKSSPSDLSFRVNFVVFSPSDANHFYIGTDTGHIAHMTQFSQRSHKSESVKYLSNDSDVTSSVTFMDIKYIPDASKTLLLAGYADGSLQLYILGQRNPVYIWPFSTSGNEIKMCKWSTCRPSVFYVLDSMHKLYIWDLIIQTSGPINTDNLSNKNLIHFCVNKPNIHKDLLKTRPEIAFLFNASSDKDRSIIELHTLSPHFSNPVDDETSQLLNLLQSVM